MLKIGVLGAGHLGKIHIGLLHELEEVELVGFYDPDDGKSENLASQYHIKAFGDVDELIDAVDIVDIVTPTLSHFECAVKAIKKFRHIFIEKPMTNTLEEAEKLVGLVEEAGIKAQVGHVERFNPAFLAAQEYDLKPMFIESHRLAPFNPRGTDVPVILDLMIHDLDIALNLVPSNVKNVSASGVEVISDSPDIASARIEFYNGCVANLTASRISLKKERKMRIFQSHSYVTMDFNKQKTDVFQMRDKEDLADHPYYMELDPGNGKGPKYICYETPDVPEVNAIQLELKRLIRSIENNEPTSVPIEDGYSALYLAHQILQKIDQLKTG